MSILGTSLRRIMGVAASATVLFLGFGVVASSADTGLYLPFLAGDTFLVTQYPHDLGNAYTGWVIDIALPAGTPVVASAAGSVVTAGNTNNNAPSINGLQVIVDHGGNFCTQYNHLSNVAVRVGQSVARGELLGHSGMTGSATGPHLHWNTIDCRTTKTLGPLTTAEYPSGFSVGMWVTSKNTPLPVVSGAIKERYLADGGSSALGYPVSNEIALPTGGTFQKFQFADIYWKQGLGAFTVHGGIQAAWRSQGAENGYLGYPTSDEIALPTGGAYQDFTGGRITWGPKTGVSITKKP